MKLLKVFYNNKDRKEFVCAGLSEQVLSPKEILHEIGIYEFDKEQLSGLEFPFVTDELTIDYDNFEVESVTGSELIEALVKFLNNEFDEEEIKAALKYFKFKKFIGLADFVDYLYKWEDGMI